MFGRIVLPIVFIDGGREVRVTELNELKRYFTSEHVQVLIKSLKDGKLEQFFFGHGKDEIKELITTLKSQGENEIKILNAVAEKIGVPRLDETLATKFTTPPGLKTLSNLFLLNQPEIYLSTDELEVVDEIISLHGRKRIVGTGLSKIRVGNLAIAGTGSSDECVIENLNFETIHEEEIVKDEFGEYPTRESGIIWIRKCKVILKQLRFKECFFDFLDADVTIIDCEFEGCLIFVSGCSIIIENSSTDYNINISDSSVKIKNSKFTDLISKNSFKNCSFEITDSEFTGITLEGSKGSIIRTKVFNGTQEGIFSANSEVNILDSQIYNCHKNGLVILNGSKVKITNLEVFSNSTYSAKDSEKNYPEIAIADSSVDIFKSKIHSGRSNGIQLIDSNVSLKECMIYENYFNGIFSENSQLNIENSSIYSNNRYSKDSDQVNGHPQIYLKNSGCTIKNSRVTEGFDVGICCDSSNLNISQSIIQKNKHIGLWISENSTFKIENSEIMENSYIKNFAQIEVSSSNGHINLSRIYSTDNFGIGTKNSKVSINNCKIYQNKKGLFFAENSDIMIENSELYENGKIGENMAQVTFLNSKGKIVNSTIYKGYSDGIGCYKSILEVINSSIYDNLKRAIDSVESKVIISSVRTWGNKEGAFLKHLPGLTYDKSCVFSDLK